LETVYAILKSSEDLSFRTASAMRNLLFSHHEQKQIPRSLSPRCARLRAARNDNESGLTAEARSYARAPLACSTRFLNAGASFTAKSARILRSNSTPATFNPWMNWL
jgi:hypothetical protein